jgi:secreted PhoX family phosphatase
MSRMQSIYPEGAAQKMKTLAPGTINRRDFMKASAALATQAVVGSSILALGCDNTLYGPLRAPDENGIRLPNGFHSRVLATSASPIGPSGHPWHHAPDGGAVFGDQKDWVYVSNSELSRGGGVGALRFSANGDVTDAYSICTNTRRNCAGGATPWGTWLTCEEVGTGLVYECDPWGRGEQLALPALGQFNHEAVACDFDRQQLYLTEDRFDGRLYRFTPNSWGQLVEGGVLEVAEVYDGNRVRWHVIGDPSGASKATRRQVPISKAFFGGEGIAYDKGFVFFTTKFDHRIWELDIGGESIRTIYHAATDPIGQLRGLDNLIVADNGDLMVAEDGGNMELVLVPPDGSPALALLRVEGQDNSELAGPAFDPSAKRLYFSSQRGTDGLGITYEVYGPFRSRRRARGNAGLPEDGKSGPSSGI